MSLVGRRCAIAVFLAVGFLLHITTATEAEARAGDGRPWPGRTIKVYSGKAFPWATKQAIQAWNKSGVKIRFRQVSSASRAQVILISYRPPLPRGIKIQQLSCGGNAQLGYLSWQKASVKIYASCRDDRNGALVIAHELGHILGLGHEMRRCALMNTDGRTGSTGLCKRPRTYFSDWCNYFARGDIQRAVKLYGGRVKPANWGKCSTISNPGRPSKPVVTGDGDEFSAKFATPKPLRKLLERTPATIPSQWIEAHVTKGFCKKRYSKGGDAATGGRKARSLFTFLTLPGSNVVGPPDPGRYCVVAWTVDGYDRHGPRSKPTWITIDPPVEEPPEDEWPEDEWPEDEWPEDEWP